MKPNRNLHLCISSLPISRKTFIGMVKYIVVCGGVISGIGKGVIASSTGLLMKAYGFRVTAIKIDPYLNIDAGTMSPLDHGKSFLMVMP